MWISQILQILQNLENMYPWNHKIVYLYCLLFALPQKDFHKYSVQYKFSTILKIYILKKRIWPCVWRNNILELNSITPQSAAGDMKWVKWLIVWCTLPCSINLTVSVDEFDKICYFVNTIFAVSLCLFNIVMVLVITRWFTVVGIVR